MLKKIIVAIVIILLLAGGVYYWYYTQNPDVYLAPDGTETPKGFFPFFRNNVKPPVNNVEPTATSTATSTPDIVTRQLPKLRQLSTTPTAGMSASSTASSSVVRFVDRGTGHVSEAFGDREEINKISNTTLPKVYESYWNKNLDVVILRYLKENSDIVTNFYSEIRKTQMTASSTSTLSPYEIRGRYLSQEIDQIVVSPIENKIFSWNIEGGKGIGYISTFDEKNKTKISDIPLTQVNIDWPETSTISITTKGSAISSGYMYSIDTKTGKTKKIFGGVKGLSAKISRDGKKAIYSGTNGDSIATRLLNIENGTTTEVIFKTLADKCVWSTLRKNEVYCAVPSEIESGVYPDEWYKGSKSFVDQIWHLDTVTGEVHILANLLTLSDKIIDATNLVLDPREDFLYFINKGDLTLWSLDLNQ